MKRLALLLAACACATRPDADPDALRAPVSWASLSSRLDQTCGLTTAGTAFCWGSGWLGSTAPRGLCPTLVDPVTGMGGEQGCETRPAPIAGRQFSRLALGDNGGFGLEPDGSLWVWGANVNQSLGFVAGAVAGPDPILSPRRSPIADTIQLSRVAAGFDGACGVAADHHLFCWGAPGARTGTMVAPACDDPGGCGVGPKQIGLRTQWTDVVVGASHACALDTSGSAGCWGAGDRGQLGHPATHTCTLAGASYPCEIEPGSAVLSQFRRIATAADLTCGLTVFDSALVCWGSPAVALAGEFADFAVNESEVCGLRSDGNTIICSGGGELSAGFKSNAGSALPETAVSLTMGQGFVCAWTKAGAAYCAGTRTLGHLGDGTAQPGAFQPTPVPVSAPYRD